MRRRDTAAAGLTTGAEARHAAYCPNCRTTGPHLVINVTSELALIWCERCRVPHAGEAEAPSAPVAPPQEPSATRRRWYW